MRQAAWLSVVILGLLITPACMPDPPTIEGAEMALYIDDANCPAMYQEVWGDFDGDLWTVTLEVGLCSDTVTVCPDWPGMAPYCTVVYSDIDIAAELAWLFDMLDGVEF